MKIALTENNLVFFMPVALDLKLSLKNHGWVYLAPWELDNDDLLRVENICGEKLRIKIKQLNKQKLKIKYDSTEVKPRKHLKKLVWQWFSLNDDYKDFISLAENLDPTIAQHVQLGGGRFLRSSTFHEDFVKTVCTINTNWSSTIRMIANIVSKIGNGAFPDPVQMVDFGIMNLKRHCRVGFRAETIISGLDQMLNTNKINATGEGASSQLTYEFLVGLKGIGPYAAAHCRILLGDYSRLAIDSEVAEFAVKILGLPVDKISSHYDSWGKYRFLGYKLNRIIDRNNWIKNR